MIEVKGLTKKYSSNSYGNQDISVTIPKGTFGLLGRNGAGKTTFIRMLATIIQPTEGECLIEGLRLGKDDEEIRKIIGYLPQNFEPYPDLTIVEFLKYIAALKGIHDKSEVNNIIEELIRKVGLTEEKNKKLKTFSGGMKRRVGIAQALIGNPKIIIVDEPTAGLDPEERVHFRNMLAEIGMDRCVIVSTHIVSDIESICNSVMILKNGKNIYNGTISDLIAMVKDKVWLITVPNLQMEEYKNNYLIVSSIYTNTGVQLKIVSDSQLKDGALTQPTLEDAYIYVMGGMSR